MSTRRLAAIVTAILALEILAQVFASQIPPPLEFDNYEQQRQVERIVAARGECTDVVLAGTSLMGAAGDPALLRETTSRTARNVALGGGGPLIMPSWFDEVVMPNLCPRTVVIGLGPRDANDSFSEQEGTVDRYLNSRGRRHLVGEEGPMQRLDRWLSRNVGFFKLRSAYRRPSTALAYALAGRGNWRQNSGEDGSLTAFDDVRYRPDPDREREIAEGSMRDFASGGRNLDAVELLIEELHDRGVRVVLIDMPRVPGAVERIIGEAKLERYEAHMAELATRQDVTLLQADDVIVDSALFADEYHVNRQGADLFTQWLAEQLQDSSDR
ncbi:MAG: hypothetical protein ACR2P0_06260 [Acidimicrobiales bacterium]